MYNECAMIGEFLLKENSHAQTGMPYPKRYGIPAFILYYFLTILFKCSHQVLRNHLCGTAFNLVTLDKMDQLSIFK